jgi:hypothetical protein
MSTRNSIASLKSKHKDRNTGLFHKVVNTTEIVFPMAITVTILIFVGDRIATLVRRIGATEESDPERRHE